MVQLSLVLFWCNTQREKRAKFYDIENKGKSVPEIILLRHRGAQVGPDGADSGGIAVQRDQQRTFIGFVADFDENFSHGAGPGAGDVECNLAGFDADDVVVAFEMIARLYIDIEHKNIPGGTLPAAGPAFRVFRHADFDGHAAVRFLICEAAL
jgi:hypothetical protein